MHLAVTSPVVPIYSGDKQRANHRSELAIPAARSTGGLRCRWLITATSNGRGDDRSLIRGEVPHLPNVRSSQSLQKMTKRSTAD
jgi:hypothetical protein